MNRCNHPQLEISRISVIGLGPVGLTTAVCLANKGFDVKGFDVDKKRAEQISRGKVPFYEPSLERMLKRTLNQGFRVCQGIEPSDLYMVVVGTPAEPDGSNNLRFVKNASEIIGNHLSGLHGYRIVAVKSTVVPGTTTGLVKTTLESSSGKKIPTQLGLVTNPEFLREGVAVKDTLRPDKVVIGSFDAKSGDAVEWMYRRFYGRKKVVFVRTNPVNAELIKYASNAFLAMKISYAKRRCYRSYVRDRSRQTYWTAFSRGGSWIRR
jgi:UDPglucose 6-dehydrogenase